ncbi:MAG: glutamine amidotransferase [Pseudomonadota bacterium]
MQPRTDVKAAQYSTPEGTSHLAPVLIVLHQETSSSGRVGQMLSAMGFGLDIRRPVLGDALPETLADHSGAVVFGGPVSANDAYDYVRAETDWLSVPLAENKPFLGICLGAQMLVNHLGGRVYGREDGSVEIGWYNMEATNEGAELIDWPKKVYQFHKEGFTLPKSAIRLASSPCFPNQAFRYGENAWGVQFHAELTQVMMHRWAVRGAHRFHLKNAQEGRYHLQGRLDHDGPLRAWLQQFLTIVFKQND